MTPDVVLLDVLALDWAQLVEVGLDLGYDVVGLDCGVGCGVVFSDIVVDEVVFSDAVEAVIVIVADVVLYYSSSYMLLMLFNS
jgi:hypothetical protein